MANFFNQSGSITMVQGDTIAILFRLSVDGVTGYDYTGQKIEFRVGKAFGGASIFVANTDNGKLVASDPSTGLAAFNLVEADTSGIAPGAYCYEMAIYTDVTKTTLIQGVFTMRGQIL